ncbi:MAG: hypothetical protein AAF702_15565 [Chloroflexota bacterium]
MDSYYDLGAYSRPVSTHSKEAQRWFDRGLIWCYGFNHEEAARCFQRALAADSRCAMACWGLAYAHGPFINKTWQSYAEIERKESVALCYDVVQRAVECSHKNPPIERALIRALTARYPARQTRSDTDYDAWNHAYVIAMRDVYEAFPADLDVITLYAEAIHNHSPWQLWDIHQGTPREGAYTIDAVKAIEAGLVLIDDQGLAPHPGLAHVYIHTMEMSPYPERAQPVADSLRMLAPDAGHLCHMPAHIDVLCGNYDKAITASDRAIDADKKYLAQVGHFDFYTTACCHDYHLKMYAAMFLGQQRNAIEAAQGITNLLTEEILRVDKPHMANTLESYYSMSMHVYVRFGRWQEIIDAPMPGNSTLYSVTTGMFHYAKGIAYAATGQIEAAEIQSQLFEQVLDTIPTTRLVFNNRAADVLAIGRAMLQGELAYRQGNYAQAFNALRKAAYLDDHLAYTEPWAWMHPPRHALGALLLEQNHVDEAERVYRADLGLDPVLNRPAQHPNNVWSLHGYMECLKRLGKVEEAVSIEPFLDRALARADVEINASCRCRTHLCLD